MNHSQTFSITQVGQVPETTLHPSILVQIPSTTYPLPCKTPPNRGIYWVLLKPNNMEQNEVIT
jgi:hypothetical protein